MRKDRYGNDLSTTSTPARDAYQAGMDSLMSATAGMDAHFAEAVAADEGFALAHISLARAKQLLGRGHEAKAPLARARELAGTATAREQSQIGIFEKIAFNTSSFAAMLANRISGGAGVAKVAAAGMATDPLMQMAPGRFLSSPGLWIGLAVAAAFLASAVRLRRMRGPL